MTSSPRTQLGVSAPADIAEEWVERAAIMEFDGGLPRAEAESEAWALILKKYGSEACVKARVLVDTSQGNTNAK